MGEAIGMSANIAIRLYEQPGLVTLDAGDQGEPLACLHGFIASQREMSVLESAPSVVESKAERYMSTCGMCSESMYSNSTASNFACLRITPPDSHPRRPAELQVHNAWTSTPSSRSPLE